MTDEEKKTPDEEYVLDNVFEQVSNKLDVDVDWLRSIKIEEVMYLLNHCPFLQMVNSQLSVNEADYEFKLVQSESGWDIHDYGDALSSSPGKFLYGGGYFRISPSDEDDDEGGGIVNPGKGTVVKQAFDTAFDMVIMAKEQGWAGIRIVDGHELMKRAAWIKAEELGMKVDDNFQPSKHDQRVKSRLALSSEEMSILRSTIR